MWTLSTSMWDPVPWPGIKPGLLHWEHRILATGPPGKFLDRKLTGGSLCLVLVKIPEAEKYQRTLGVKEAPTKVGWPTITRAIVTMCAPAIVCLEGSRGLSWRKLPGFLWRSRRVCPESASLHPTLGLWRRAEAFPFSIQLITASKESLRESDLCPLECLGDAG